MGTTSERSIHKHICYHFQVHYLQTKVLAKVFIGLISNYGTSELVASFVFLLIYLHFHKLANIDSSMVMVRLRDSADIS